MKDIVVSLSFKKATKGTNVYENTEHGIVIYVPKALMGDSAEKPPTTATMTIAAGQ